MAALAAGASTANAGGGLKDDAPVAEARSCSGGRFAGLYVGGTIGYAHHEDEKTDIDDVSFGESEGGFAGAVHYGYNWQCGRLVIGTESDFGAFDGDTSQIDPIDPNITLSSDIDWYSTTRLRLGLVHDDRLLFYVTGGLAYADVEHTLSDPTLGFTGTNSDKQWGWTVGGGVELLRVDGWAWRAEALYIDLGSESETYDATTACGFTCTADYDWDDEFWVARLGLSYKFGDRREEVVPLK